MSGLSRSVTGLRVLLPIGAALCCAASGCGFSIVGDWKLDKALPSREVFALDDAHFAEDGSFAATVTLDGKSVRHEGSYRFNGFKLTLRPAAGGQYRWDAFERFGRLHVHDDERKVILRKVKPRQVEEPSPQ